MAETAYVEVPDELAALPIDRHAIVEASAGTGKTHLLEHRLVDLVVSGRAEIDQILVVTFTERATAELRSRVRGLLARTRAAAPGPEPAGRHWVIDDVVRDRLRAAIVAFDRAPIETIHAFCQHLLVRHAFAGGRLFEQRRVDREAAFHEAFGAALRAELACKPAYRPALAAWLGSGETVDGLRRLLLRADGARARLTPVWQAEALSAALRELPDSLRSVPSIAAALIGGGITGGSQKWITLRAEKLVAIAGAHADNPFAALAALDEDEKDESAADFIDERIGGKVLRPGAAADLATWARRLRPHLVPLRAAVVQSLLPPVQERLAVRKRREGLYDFNDMLEQVWLALCGPHGDELARTLRNDYPWALVDEFQDTDELQWRILRRVFVEAPDRCRLCAIGDPKQAIYGFRAADVQTYLAARAEIAGGGGAVLPLVRNFRSTAPLIDALNEILRDDAPSPLLAGEIRYTAPAVAAGGQSAVGLDGAAPSPVVIWHMTPDADAKLTAGALRGALGVRMTAEVRALLATPSPLRVGKAGQERPIAARDIYVLTRTTADAVEAARHLRGAGVPCALFRSDGLFQSPEARAIRDLLAGVARPERRSDRAKAWRTPFFAVPLATLYGLDDVPESEPLLARLLGWRALADRLAYEELFAAIVDESGILRREILLADGERALTNYLHIFELLLDEISRSRCDLPELVLRMQGLIDGTRALAGEGADEQRLETEHAAVRIMTMHMAKGLEAAVVFLYVGFGPPPGDQVRVYHAGGERLAHVGKVRGDALTAAVDREREGEDERLLYVALTRARARLYLPFVAHKQGPDWGGYKPLARRLADIVAQAAEPAITARFVVEAVVVPAGRGGGAAVAAAASAARAVAAAPVAPWTPAPELLAAAPVDAELDRLALRRRGPTLTSYTRMKSRGGGADPEPRGATVGPDELPGGAGVGLLLHDLLERAPREGALAAANAEAWAADGVIAAELRAAMAARDIDPRWRGAAAALAHRALTCPLALPGGGRLPGVAGAARCLREIEFAFPIPAAPPWLGPPPPGGVVVGPGYVEGAIDVLVEHDGVAYVIDWKSDVLADYSPAALAAHVEGHYEVQARLYALAVARMLGLGEADAGRLGGVGFLFLRGLAAPDAAGGGQPGMYWITPSWRDLGRWAENLAREALP